jgi:hypothetical protein
VLLGEYLISRRYIIGCHSEPFGFSQGKLCEEAPGDPSLPWVVQDDMIILDLDAITSPNQYMIILDRHVFLRNQIIAGQE